MGLYDRISRLVRANINDSLSQAQDPVEVIKQAIVETQINQQAGQIKSVSRNLKNLEEKLSQLQSLQARTLATQIDVNNSELNQAEDAVKILEQVIIDMQEDLVQLRQAVATAIATQKRTQQQYTQAESQANTWYQRAQLALKKGDENLAKKALICRKTHVETAATLKSQLDQQAGQVEGLKRNLVALESKISEAKTKKNMLKARVQAAKANEQLQGLLGGINTSGSAATFERMEEKVLAMEARSQAEAKPISLEEQFALLESSSDMDAELAAIKANILTGSSDETKVDDDLEQLRKQLNNI